LSKIDKLLKKFYEKPIPNDITFDEAMRIMKHFGCIIENGGNHTKVVCKQPPRVIPIPRHGKNVEEAYIKQLKELLDLIRGG
jgi:UDP-N-acetylglucosamine pyrophosphorylase